MGGSALPANLLKTYLSVSKTNFNIPIKINRDYSLPSIVDENWCGFFDSYSGNTEETLAAIKEAEKKRMKQIIVLAHAGKLQEIAIKKGYTFIEIPDYSQPRMSYGFIIGALLKVFHNSKLIELDIEELKSDVNKCLIEMPNFETLGQDLAGKTKGKIPLIYSSNVWKYVAMVWKINFNENTKTQSFWNAFPELNHNEMVGFKNLIAEYKNIILMDSAEHEQIKKRMEIAKKEIPQVDT